MEIDVYKRQVMVVTNLKPAKLAGILSEGMILCAEDAEGNVCVVSPEKNMPTGSETVSYTHLPGNP